jgi:hypothetical protein
MNENNSHNSGSSFFEKILKIWGTIMAAAFAWPAFSFVMHGVRYPEYFLYNLKVRVDDPSMVFSFVFSILSVVSTFLIIRFRKNNNKTGIMIFLSLFAAMTVILIVFVGIFIFLTYFNPFNHGYCPNC